MIPPRLACLVVVLCLLVAPAAASADTSFQSGDVTGQISAHGSDLAYVNGRLYLGFGAAARAVPVPSRAGFFGIDLGTDSKGRTTLIYSRCSKGARCDLFTYGLASKKERKLKSLSRSRCTERNPLLVRGTVVFVREKHRSRKRRLRCAGGIYRKRPGKRLRRISRSTPFELDFDGRRIVFSRQRGDLSQIRAFAPGKRSKLLGQARGSDSPGGFDGTSLSHPALDGGRAYWVRSTDHTTTSGGVVNDIVRRKADGSGAQEVLSRSGRLWVNNAPDGIDEALGGVAVAGDRLYYSYSVFRIGLVSGAPVFR